MRVFLAIDVPNYVKEAISKLQNELKGPCYRLVPPENAHITLNFYGELSDDAVKVLIGELKNMQFQKPKLEFKGVGVFPSLDYVRVVWLGVNGCEELAKLTCGKGKCSNTCHLTLARVRCRVDVKPFLEKHKGFELEPYMPEHLTLYESVLKRPHAEYKVIAKLPL